MLMEASYTRIRRRFPLLFTEDLYAIFWKLLFLCIRAGLKHKKSGHVFCPKTVDSSIFMLPEKATFGSNEIEQSIGTICAQRVSTFNLVQYYIRIRNFPAGSIPQSQHETRTVSSETSLHLPAVW